MFSGIFYSIEFIIYPLLLHFLWLGFTSMKMDAICSVIPAAFAWSRCGFSCWCFFSFSLFFLLLLFFLYIAFIFFLLIVVAVIHLLQLTLQLLEEEEEEYGGGG